MSWLQEVANHSYFFFTKNQNFRILIFSKINIQKSLWLNVHVLYNIMVENILQLKHTYSDIVVLIEQYIQ